ncbi:MAG: T9SS type A sorting domain-containing protein [Bacteroidota bacterium]
MKTNYYIITKSILLVAFLAFSGLAKSQVMVNDSVTMGATYSNEIYYSMSNGQVSSHARNTWDLAFRTFAYSSSILINDGSGVVLYSYPKSDTSGYATMDTIGLSTFPVYYNDPEDWENGAFSRSATGHPNYGWCVYNSITHNLHGDSLYIVKLRNGSLKKIFVYLKNSIGATYYFKYANMDGTDAHDIAMDCNPYMTKDFVGYDLQTNVVVDFQAPKANWDLLFTKYMSVQPNGTPYPVMGVLSNPVIGVERYAQVDPAFMAWGSLGFDETRQPIGWNWKTFSGTSWSVEDSLIFFVRDQAGDVYRMAFNKFGGSATGKIVFGKSKISVTGIAMNNNPASLELYPNPVGDVLNVKFFTETHGPAEVKVFDLLGNIVYNDRIELVSGTNQMNMNVNEFKPGVYTFNIQSGLVNITKKLIVNR